MKTSHSNKYNASTSESDGVKFDSKAEARRYAELQILLKSGKIKNLVTHPAFEILPAFEYMGQKVRAMNYSADFMYYDNELGRTIIEDVKGYPTREFKTRWKMIQYQNRNDTTVELRIVK